jgi:phenylalanyl-tRNA synthetase beta chain
MKVSLNSIRQLNEHFKTTGDVAAIGVDKLIEKIGAQLGAVEEIVDLGRKYRDIVVAKIVSAEQHPNADRLKVCMIDDGGTTPDVKRDEQGLVQVVCGAPNAREGLTVAWLPPGSTVPETIGKDPFVLEARELRGVVSNGMLASPKELALGDSHDGILEINDDLKPGTDFAEAYGLKDDVVLDLENKMFTHRPDCFGLLGVARELAGIQSMPFKSPEWYRPDVELPGVETGELPLTVRNEVPELVLRFTAIPMRDIQIKPSPVWLQVELSKVGIRSINNIVDYTNYFMLLTGQPLHAYDYDKVKAQDNGADHATIVVRNPRDNEKLTLLNGKTIDPRQEAVMIATETKAIGLGGVMGGADTEVDENTRNIILESASFDMYSVRRTSMAHGLFTDAVTRFNKGQSPLQNLAVLALIVQEIRNHAGGKVAGPLIDDNHLPQAVRERHSLFPPVGVTAEFINARLGTELSATESAKLLQNVEFEVATDGDSLSVTAPFWRTDIELREDVVEEVGRLYGFDHLPLTLPPRYASPTRRDADLDLKAQVRSWLRTAGANELLTYSFVHGNLLEKAGQDKAKAFRLGNALSPDLQYYRLSLTPSLLDKVHANQKAGFELFALFELGKAHAADMLDEHGLPHETDQVAFVIAANKKAVDANYAGAAYYEARLYAIELLTATIPAEDIRLEPAAAVESGSMSVLESMLKPYDAERSAVVFVRNTPVGVIGEFTQGVRRALKLPLYAAGFELLLDAFKAQPKNPYKPLSRYPKVSQDITLRVAADVPFQKLQACVHSEILKSKPEHTDFVLLPLGIYQAADDASHKNISLRLVISSQERTLTDREVAALLDAVTEAASRELSAERL